MAKYNQLEEYKYYNNEFENMPSCGLCYGEDLTTKTKEQVDWNKVGEIVAKHGLHYALITNTFGGFGEYGVYRTRFFLYYMPNIPNYENVLKRCREKGDWREFHEMRLDEKFGHIYDKMHECAHELDEETSLYFNTDWCGNCGHFGTHDVSRRTYSQGNDITTWKTLTDIFPPLITDVSRQLKKGLYISLESRFLKPTDA